MMTIASESCIGDVVLVHRYIGEDFTATVETIRKVGTFDGRSYSEYRVRSLTGEVFVVVSA